MGFAWIRSAAAADKLVSIILISIALSGMSTLEAKAAKANYMLIVRLRNMFKLDMREGSISF